MNKPHASLATIMGRNDVVSIMNRKTGKVLQQSADKSIQALDTDLDDRSHQWFRISVDGKFFAYKNVGTGLVLDHWYGRRGGGNLVAKTDVVDHINHQWRESPYDHFFVALENRKSELYLDHYYDKDIRVNGESGFHVNRQWCLIHHPAYNEDREVVVTITSYSSGRVLADDGDVKALNAQVHLAKHKWRRLPTGQSKVFVFKNVASGMVLSLGQQGVEASDDNNERATHQWRWCDVEGGHVAFQNRASGRILRYAQTIHTGHSICTADDVWVVRILPGAHSSGVVEDSDLIDQGTNTESLFVAAQHGYLDQVRYLLAHGADASSPDKEGNSALMLLLHGNGNEETILPIAKLLLEHGTPARKSNKSGKSAKSVARQKGFNDVLDLLDEYAAKADLLLHDDYPDWLIAPADIKREPISFAHDGFGKVFKATWRNLEVVLKEIDITTAEKMREFQKGVRLWRSLTHDNIIQFYGANHREPPFFTVSKFAVHGSLRDYLSENSRFTWRKLKEVAAGLSYLHQKGIAHADLMCDNILVGEKGVAMLTHFCLNFYDTTASSTVQQVKNSWGGKHWYAPELASMTVMIPSFESDVYSLGMCIIEAVKITTPWNELCESALIRSITTRREVKIEKPHEMTDDQWSLVKSMVAFDCTKRLSLNDVLAVLNDFADEEAGNEAGLRSRTHDTAAKAKTNQQLNAKMTLDDLAPK